MLQIEILRAQVYWKHRNNDEILIYKEKLHQKLSKEKNEIEEDFHSTSLRIWCQEKHNMIRKKTLKNL